MKFTKILGAMSGLLCGTLFVAIAFADIPVPPRDVPPGKIDVPMVVKYDANKDVSFLRISRQVLVQANANKKADWTPSPSRSIIAAIAMSVGIAGAFFVRGRRRLGLAAAALVSGTFMITSAMQSLGNAAPPPKQSVALPADFRGGVVVEIVEHGFSVELIIGTKKPPERGPYSRPAPQPVPPKPEEKKT